MYSYLVNLISSKFFSIEKNNQTDEGMWTRYYVEVFLVNIFKTTLVLICALILKTYLTTVIGLLCFRQLRKYANGWHSDSSIYCSLQCLFFFVFLPKLFMLTAISFNLFMLTVFYLLELIVFCFYSQLDFEKNTNPKKKIYITLLLFYGLSITLKAFPIIQYGIIIGVLSESLLVLPISKKIVKGEFICEIKKVLTGKNGVSG